MFFFVFQFLSMVFLAMIRATNKVLLFSAVVLVDDMSPKRHRDGESWIGLSSA